MGAGLIRPKPGWLAGLDPASLGWQALALLACVAAAWLVGRRYRAWQRGQLAEQPHSQLRRVGISFGCALVFPAVASALLLVAWAGFSALGLPSGVLRWRWGWWLRWGWCGWSCSCCPTR